MSKNGSVTATTHRQVKREVVGISYRLRQLDQQLECARLTIENRENQIRMLTEQNEGLKDDLAAYKSDGAIAKARATTKYWKDKAALQTSMLAEIARKALGETGGPHHPGCGKYIRHLKARLLKYEDPPWEYDDE